MRACSWCVATSTAHAGSEPLHARAEPPPRDVVGARGADGVIAAAGSGTAIGIARFVLDGLFADGFE